MRSRGVKFTTIDGNFIWMNPEFVVMVTPMFADGVLTVNRAILHVMGAKIPVEGSPETVAYELWEKGKVIA